MPDATSNETSANARVDALIVAHRAELLAFLERRVQSRALAEDLVQQVAVRALAAASTLKSLETGRAWLFQITRNLLSDHHRGARSQSQLPADLEADSDSDEFGCACVLANLQALKSEHALVLQRVVVDGISIASLADELKVSVNAATVRVHRARAALRERLLAHCGTASLRDCLDCACSERGCCDAHASEGEG